MAAPGDVAAVVWIDTDGKFYIKGFDNPKTAEQCSRFTNESGLPAVILKREEVIEGDFKSVAQLESEEDDPPVQWIQHDAPAPGAPEPPPVRGYLS